MKWIPLLALSVLLSGCYTDRVQYREVSVTPVYSAAVAPVAVSPVYTTLNPVAVTPGYANYATSYPVAITPGYETATVGAVAIPTPLNVTISNVGYY